ncbi:VacB/RNase II family 3'-5' exoribonuclease [uncultured Thalassolituus sp.]|jgi:exoribonuclease-2/ribonuclease R|uniref:VacB/RNase II family 3'-5' exoribonuclease n=1 Tax=Thalassolituus sp. TaxID=2030822 RepID=UPI00261AC885|nr:VacB/RNase II family 3'-5' exoribonuclease [uncultured Thalassolituus sp.]
MLDINALSQLKQLKQEIHENTPRFDGRVRGSSGRFGFAVTEEGQSYFLSPDEMEKVLPGDEISFRVEPAGDDKEQALVEKLIRSEISDFCGRYIVRGKGHFIEPDHDQFNRWIFVPPNARMNAKDGDYVAATMSRHPYPSGKAQAKIEAILGDETTPHIERLVMQQRFALSAEFSEDVMKEVENLVAAGIDAKCADRTDLTHLPFVTIDSAGTRDIDDALFAEAHSDGWTLWVGIADPEALIDAGSALDNEARKRSTSVYFADRVLPMLPPELSEQLCSLQAGSRRLAMVAELRLEQDGNVREVKLHNALIESRAKLTYAQVAQLIDDTCEEIPAELHGPLRHLADCARTLNQWRAAHCLLMDDRPDYKLILGEDGRASDIVKIERNAAHKLVEECMLVCNRSVALWLRERNAGFFIEQNGIRTERLGEAAALLKEQLNLEGKPVLGELESYVALLQQAEQSSSDLPLRTILSRQMERSQFGREGKPHMGLGFNCYTTFTSPLRKYNDFLIHRTVRALLNDEPAPAIEDDVLTGIQDMQTRGRIGASQAEQWLKLQWLQTQPENGIYEGTIVHMNSGSLTVRLDDTGIEGVIDRRKAKGWTYDSKTMTHSNGEERFILGQPMRVIVHEIDVPKRSLKLRMA